MPRRTPRVPPGMEGSSDSVAAASVSRQQSSVRQRAVARRFSWQQRLRRVGLGCASPTRELFGGNYQLRMRELTLMMASAGPVLELEPLAEAPACHFKTAVARVLIERVPR